jgi:GNAT superfamily N-acetyltransferase
VTSISVRLAAPDQLAEIPGIELSAATMFPVEDLSSELRYKVTPQTDLREALAAQRLWVALCGEDTIGFALASVVDDVGYLDELGVQPEFGRQGAGRQLVSAVIDWARAEGFPRLTLITFRHLAWNAPFYAKLGFQEMESTEHGRELAGLIEEERLIGIDVAKRVAMRLDL